VQRALGIRRSVLQKEQSEILKSQAEAQATGEVNEFP
jgi:hypothetical protein